MNGISIGQVNGTDASLVVLGGIITSGSNGHITSSGNLDVDGNISASSTSTLTMGGNIITKGTGAVISGSIIKATAISASGMIHSQDEYRLIDASPNGDTLIRQYASGDDGVIDVYQTNFIRTRISADVSGSSFIHRSLGVGNFTNNRLPYTGSGVLSSGTQTTASLHVSASYSNIRFENLPTQKPTVTGSLWLSGSAGQGSQYLVVFNGS